MSLSPARTDGHAVVGSTDRTWGLAVMVVLAAAVVTVLSVVLAQRLGDDRQIRRLDVTTPRTTAGASAVSIPEGLGGSILHRSGPQP